MLLFLIYYAPDKILCSLVFQKFEDFVVKDYGLFFHRYGKIDRLLDGSFFQIFFHRGSIGEEPSFYETLQILLCVFEIQVRFLIYSQLFSYALKRSGMLCFLTGHVREELLYIWFLETFRQLPVEFFPILFYPYSNAQQLLCREHVYTSLRKL
ncbi:Cytochrome P450 2C8 [Thermotoga neapolitana DSM 4359]|uniref:Cytochrome P450 2C8 n=1 Tax=Thermotoga neapolitana (strain ATCC 49049 / DSM 4359 / NBRC 107923 / NS-E) TaxID=309803 RepID=B9K739_THENN|nr:Cytochrome P450 2C8 [Thermotoga neapolitana DSM 4359]